MTRIPRVIKRRLRFEGEVFPVINSIAEGIPIKPLFSTFATTNPARLSRNQMRMACLVHGRWFVDNINHYEQESRHGSGVCSFFIRVIRGSHGGNKNGPRITRMTRIGKNNVKTRMQFAACKNSELCKAFCR